MRHINFCRNSVQQVQVRPWWQRCSSTTLSSQLRSTATPDRVQSAVVYGQSWPCPVSGGLRPQSTLASQTVALYIYIVPSIPVLLCGVTYKNIVNDITSHIINPTWRYVKETVHTVWPEFICNFACRIYVVGGRGDELSGLNQSVNQSVN